MDEYFEKEDGNSSFFPENNNRHSSISEGSMISKSSELSEIDRELEELVKRQQSKVKVFGVGGGGNNTISRMR